MATKNSDIVIVLPDSGRQGRRYEINGIEDDSSYFDQQEDALEAIKEKFPNTKTVYVMTSMGDSYKHRILGEKGHYYLE